MDIRVACPHHASETFVHEVRRGAVDFEPNVIIDRELITSRNLRSNHLIGEKLVQALKRTRPSSDPRAVAGGYRGYARFAPLAQRKGEGALLPRRSHWQPLHGVMLDR